MLHDGYWIAVRDGDDRARWLFDRHYSRYHYADGRKPRLFVGPGAKLVLLTEDCRALWVWRRFIDKSGQTGVNCAVFRNEGPIQSSRLVIEACQRAWARWPSTRLYTYVNERGITSDLPGACFLAAGWRYQRQHGHRVRTAVHQLLVLECSPARLRPAQGVPA
jgi:hypothetical protein